MGRIQTADGKGGLDGKGGVDGKGGEASCESKKTDSLSEPPPVQDEVESPKRAAEDGWGMDVIWDTTCERACTPCDQTISWYTCFGFFDGWSALERNFFLLLLVILLYQLHFFSFFHSSNIEIGLKHEMKHLVTQQRKHSELYEDEAPRIDTKGVNWAAIYKRETQLCVNLDSIIKSTDQVTSDERALWGKLNCQEELKELYHRW